jgi:hypothetical protein
MYVVGETPHRSIGHLSPKNKQKQSDEERAINRHNVTFDTFDSVFTYPEPPEGEIKNRNF